MVREIPDGASRSSSTVADEVVVRLEGEIVNRLVPQLLHAHTAGLSLVFDCGSGRIPRLVYWGAELTGENPESLQALATASQEALDGNAPDVIVETGIIPLEADGWKGRPGLAGYREDGTAWSPRFALANVMLPAGTVATNDFAETGPGIIAFELEDGSSELSLTLVVEVLKEGIARMRVTLTNRGNSPYYLQELGVALPLPLEAGEILDLTGRWGKESCPQRRPVFLGCSLREGRHGRTGFDAPGMTYVGTAGFSFRQGEIWAFHTAFSGNHRTWVEKLPSGEQVVGGSEVLLPGEGTLAPGEAYTTPWFYALQAEGLDRVASRLHTWMRGREQHPSTPRPVALNVWEAVYFHHDLDQLKNLADIAAAIGVERYVVDDGWFRGRHNDWAGLGDWEADPVKWPGGLNPLADHVRSLGMQFGLWFEPEMINPDSELARAHPEWILSAHGSSPEGLPMPWRHQQVLNIAIPAARQYIEDRVVALVREYGIDYIKWDHNRDLIEPGDQTQGGRAAAHRQTLAYYALVDAIKQRCPGLEIESCSSGGGRIDLEVLQHTDRVWVSDCIDPVERQGMVRWLAQMVPLEMMGTHVASPHSHTTGRWSPMSMRGATALWGHFGIEWDIASASEEELAELEQWIAYYKQHRAFLHRSTLVRCESPDESIWLHGAVSAGRSRALFQMVTRHRSPISPRGRLRFAGLDPAQSYRIRPRLVGAAPSGLVAPAWFGTAGNSDSTSQRIFNVSDEFSGLVMTGQALHQAGVQAPRMHPDQVLLIEVTAENHHQ